MEELRTHGVPFMATAVTATAPKRLGPDPATYVWQVPVFLLGAAVFVAAWQGWLPLGTPDPAADFARELGALRAASEKVSPDRDELKELLTRAAAKVDAFPEVSADARLALGSGYARLAELTVPIDEARGHWTLAKQHFDLVRSEQLRDPNDSPRLAFRAAKARAAVGFPADAPAADLRLHIALLGNAPFGEELGEAGRLRADLAQKLTPPDIATAVAALTEYLQKTGIATPATSLARAKLTLGELHLRKNELELARKWLSEIATDSPPDVLAQGKMLLARVKIKDGPSPDWLGAARDLEALRSLPQGVPPALRATSAYHLGVCKARTGEAAAAEKLFEEATKGTGPEAVASNIELAGLYLKGADPARRAVVPGLLETAVKGVTEPRGFRNPLVSVQEAQRTFELANAALLEEGAHESALKVAETYKPLAPAGKDREMRAETLAAWAQSLEKAKGDSRPKASAAAAEFEAIAALRPTSKAELLRRAAAMHRLAGDATKAIEDLRAALRVPQLPETLVGPLWSDLADQLIAAKRPDEAIKAFNETLANIGPVSTATRYKLAIQFSASRHPGYAPLGRALFEQIARQEKVAPAEQEYHERALVELGHDHIRAGKFGEAESWLRKGLSIYPTGPEASLGRLLLGVCLLQRSNAAPTSGGDPMSVAATVAALRQEALRLFKQITADTEAKLARDKKLSERDGWLRLQAGLRVLQTYQQLQLPNELLAEASPLLERHRGTIEELIIWSLVYHAFKQKGETGRALQTRDQMKALFDHLPESAFPVGATGEYSRKYWEDVWFNGK